MKIKKRYDEYNQYETFDEEQKKSKARIALNILLCLIGVVMWGIAIVLTASDERSAGMFLGAFFYSIGVLCYINDSYVTGLSLTILGVISFIATAINHGVELAIKFFFIGFIVIIVSKIIESHVTPKKEHKAEKNYYRKSDGGNLFINGLEDDFDEDTTYSVGEVHSKINDIKRQEQHEKEENNGKMISDSYMSFFSEMPKEKKLKFKIILTLSIVGVCMILPSIFFQRAGIVVGGLLIMWGTLLINNPPPPTGYNYNNSKYMAIALLIPGVAMFLCNLIFHGDSATIIWVFVLFLAVTLTGFLTNYENTEYMTKNATDLIQAVCVDVEKKSIYVGDGQRRIELYPVFEIEYKGMRKRLMARFPYSNPPEIGVRRIIYINPNNLDEWYDPQNMKFM